MHMDMYIGCLIKLTLAQQIIQKHNVKSNEKSEGSKVESVISKELNLNIKLVSYHIRVIFEKRNSQIRFTSR